MRLVEVMTVDVLTTSADASIAAAARAMAERSVGSACVVDAQQSLEGIITERDVLRAAGSGRDLSQERVAGWMTRDPVTVAPDELPSEVARKLREGRFRHLPVCDEGRLVGVLSMRDLWAYSFLPAEPDDMTLRQ
ncbi:MAG TPA: CBS domain-containing protein [Nitriliruptorales bacterium]|nr:CBS domain-containing protein [Nitriliruptorales bacterium]